MGPLLAELVRVTRRTVLFTIWPSEAGDVFETHEDIAGVIFPHRAYSDAYIRRQLAEHRPDLAASTDLHVFSAELWAYAVHLGVPDPPAPSVLPFRGYSQRQARYLQGMLADLQDRTRTIAEMRDGIERSEGRGARLEQEIEEGRRAVAPLLERLDEVERALASERAAANTARDELACVRQRLDHANAGLTRTRQLLGSAQRDAGAARKALERTARDLAQARDAAQGAQSRANAAEEAARDERERTKAALDTAALRLEDRERQLSAWRDAARTASLELSALRGRRLVRALRRLRPGPDLSPQINPIFQDFLDDGRLFLDRVHRYRLHASEDIHASRALSYALELERADLAGLLLAPIFDFPDDKGALEIELSAPDGLALARAQVPLADIVPHRPVRFTFSPIAVSDAPMTLRVAARDTASPVRLFEWRRYPRWGVGAVATQPFCAFVFA